MSQQGERAPEQRRWAGLFCRQFCGRYCPAVVNGRAEPLETGGISAHGQERQTMPRGIGKTMRLL